LSLSVWDMAFDVFPVSFQVEMYWRGRSKQVWFGMPASGRWLHSN